MVHPAVLRLDGDDADDVVAVDGGDPPGRRRPGPPGDRHVMQQEAVDVAHVVFGDARGERCRGLAEVCRSGAGTPPAGV